MAGRRCGEVARAEVRHSLGLDPSTPQVLRRMLAVRGATASLRACSNSPAASSGRNHLLCLLHGQGHGSGLGLIQGQNHSRHHGRHLALHPCRTLPGSAPPSLPRGLLLRLQRRLRDSAQRFSQRKPRTKLQLLWPRRSSAPAEGVLCSWVPKCLHFHHYAALMPVFRSSAEHCHWSRPAVRPVPARCT